MGNLVNKSINSNYIKDGKTLTGKLYFGEVSFCFKAQSVNGLINYGEIKYELVEKVTDKNTFGIIPNRVQIFLKDGRNYVFVTLKRKMVKNFLISRIM